MAKRTQEERATRATQVRRNAEKNATKRANGQPPRNPTGLKKKE